MPAELHLADHPISVVIVILAHKSVVAEDSRAEIEYHFVDDFEAAVHCQKTTPELAKLVIDGNCTECIEATVSKTLTIFRIDNGCSGEV